MSSNIDSGQSGGTGQTTQWGSAAPAPGEEGSVGVDGKIKGSGQESLTAESLKRGDTLEAYKPLASIKIEDARAHLEKMLVDPKNPQLPMPTTQSLDPNSQSWFSGVGASATVAMVSAMMALVEELGKARAVDTVMQNLQELQSRESAKNACEISQDGAEKALQEQTAATITGCTLSCLQFALAFHSMGSYYQTRSNAAKAADEAKKTYITQKPGKPIDEFEPPISSSANKKIAERGNLSGAEQKELEKYDLDRSGYLRLQKNWDVADKATRGPPPKPPSLPKNKNLILNDRELSEIEAHEGAINRNVKAKEDWNNKSDTIDAKNAQKSTAAESAVWQQANVKAQAWSGFQGAMTGFANAVEGQLRAQAEYTKTISSAQAELTKEAGQGAERASSAAGESKKNMENLVYQVLDGISQSLQKVNQAQSELVR